MKRLLAESFVLILLSGALGFARSLAPNGIAWNGRWPTSATSAEDAYNMMARPGDPPLVTLQDAVELQRDNRVIFLDARAKTEFDLGRIPRARALPFYEMDQYQEAALKNVTAETPVVLYCEGIGCELSFFLGRELQAAGFTDLRIFYGGYPEWKDAGLPVEK